MNTISDRELLQQALEALDAMRYMDLAQAGFVNLPAKIRARLAEPEEADVEQLARIAKLVDEVDPYPEAEEPVAWMYDRYSSVNIPTRCVELLDDECKNIRPLYLHPPRPAVRLSDEELNEIFWEVGVNTCLGRAIEAAVLKKNGLIDGN